MSNIETIIGSIRRVAAARPDGVALVDADRPPMTYAALASEIDAIASELRAHGIERTDRIAVAMPDGADLALVFLAASSAAACAPLNPAYTDAEFGFFLDDLEPAVLILPPTGIDAARRAAEARGVVVIEANPAGRAAGSILLRGWQRPGVDAPTLEPALDDVALILHTSGTTGRPKQVPLSHRNLALSASNVATTLGLTPDDRGLAAMPLFHIHGIVAALLASLVSGASVACPGRFDPGSFPGWLDAFEPTWYTAVPTIHQAVLGVTDRHAGAWRGRLRLVRSSSAPLPPIVLERLEERFGCPVVEAYGMTEAAHQIACNPLPPGTRKPGTVGRAAGPEVAIMGDDGALLATGATGEIVIRGPNVTSGYTDPEATAIAFRDGWFRTGDEGWLDDEGYLTITGRSKELINRGGEKIAPREVEDVLLAHPSVAEAVAFAVPHPTLGEEVGAAVVARETFDAEELRAWARQHLAPFKVPHHLVPLDRLPRGATGKLKRIGLAADLGLPPDVPARGAPADLAASSPAEAAIAGVWSYVLGVPAVGVDIDLLSAGGDSLAAIEIADQLEELLGVEVEPADIVEGATVRSLAALATSAPRRRAPVAQEPEPGSLTPAQRRLWFLHRVDPTSPAYNEHLALRLRGPLDEGALRAAVDGVVERHETLRTIFPTTRGEPRAVVLPAGPVDLERLDTSSTEDPAAAARAAAQRLVRRPWDLEQGPLLRAALIAIGPDDHLLVLAYHHVAADGTSRDLLRADVESLYASVADGTAAPPRPAGSYSSLSRSRASDDAIEHWRGVLTPLPPPVELPLDRMRGSEQPVAGDSVDLALDGSVRADGVELGRAESATLFMVLLATFVATVHRHTGAVDVTIGVPVSGRRGAAADVVGPFVNTVLVRVAIDPTASFRELLHRVRDASIAAYRHQDVPFETVVEAVRPPRDPSRAPLAQLMFQLRRRSATLSKAGALSIEQLVLPAAGAKLDVAVDVTDDDHGLLARIDFAPDLFDPRSMRSFGARWNRITVAALRDPASSIEALPVGVSDDDEAIAAFELGAAPARPLTAVHVQIEAASTAAPDEPALRDDSVPLTRGELLRASCAVAASLRAAGVRRGDSVLVAIERSVRAAVAILGCLRAGARFVPIDPAGPPQRAEEVMAAARPTAVLTEPGADTSWAADVPTLVVEIDRSATVEPVEPVEDALDSDAYVLFTSGSTGVPKGVIGTHRGIANRLAWGVRALPYESGEVCVARAPLVFVDSIAELLGPLAAGVPLVILSDETSRDPRALVDRLHDVGATRLLVVPSLLRAILRAVPDAGERAPRLGVVVSSGEPLAVDDAAAFFESFPGRRLVNIYGTTEVAADATASIMDGPPDTRAPDVHIGRPLDGVRVAVLDHRRQRVPVGVVGEIHVGGAGLARGYVADPELTAARFIDDPALPGVALYATGDLGRWDADGNLHHRGRGDRQVKVRGVRVEPAEVEGCLRSVPGVTDAVVVAEGAITSVRLVAHVMLTANAEHDPSTLRAAIAAVLPSPAVPSAFVVHESFPRTGTGKVDVGELARRSSTDAPQVATLEGTAGRVAEVWRQLLPTSERLDADTDFFDAGGHSLLAVELTVRIAEDLGVELPLAQVFLTPVLRDMAAAIDALRRGDAVTVPYAIELSSGSPGGSPLFWCPAVGGTVLSLRWFASQLKGSVSLIGFETPGHRPGEAPLRSIEAVAAHCIESMRRVQPHGPYRIGGNSFGGIVAFEMARQLTMTDPGSVDLLIVVDSWPPDSPAAREAVAGRRARSRRRWRHPLRELRRRYDRSRDPERSRSTSIGRVVDAHRAAVRSYVPGTIDCDMVLLTTDLRREASGDESLGWGRLVRGTIDARAIPGRHGGLVSERGSGATTAAAVRAIIEAADQRKRSKSER